MLTHAEIEDIVSNIQYKDWRFVVNESKNVPYLQIQFDDACSVTGKVETQYCRKWQLSYFMVRSEVVRTAMKALLAAVEHEAMEHFKYRGRTIYSPHFNVDVLQAMATNRNFDYRDKDDNKVATPRGIVTHSSTHKLSKVKSQFVRLDGFSMWVVPCADCDGEWHMPSQGVSAYHNDTQEYWKDENA